MEKLLTISIAAYNVAPYIRETLDSLVASKFIDQLEIFIIDDGGKDETLKIAEEYQKQFPSSIFPVHKENGGYGTTVNYSLDHSKGKYFKLLDGDDWVNTTELDKLISVLKNLETDVVVTPYASGPTQEELNKVDFENLKKLEKSIKISHVQHIDTVGMWAICYKTDILKKSGLRLPDRLFYTDQIYCTIPFAFAKTIQYFDYTVYCYRVGREGQSVSRESRIKNIDMTLDICKMLSNFTVENKNNANYEYILSRVTSYYFSALKTILLLPPNEESRKKLKEYDREIKGISLDLYQKVQTYNKLGKFIALSRRTDYFAIYGLKLIYPKGIPNWA